MSSPPRPPSKTSPILVVGAGVFGLTTTLHLSHRGYTNIHLFDSQPYDQTHYSVASGGVAASCDENKILRASYGEGKLYQDLAFEAMREWGHWNDVVASQMSDEELRACGLERGEKLWEQCGFLRVGETWDGHEEATQWNFPAGIRGTQYRVGDQERVREAVERDGISEAKIDPFRRRERGLETDGVLDMTAGFVLASKACAFALWLCGKREGVTLHLGRGEGEFKGYVRDGQTVKGIETVDGKTHAGELVIVAAGGWTPSLVHQADRLLETTAGSIVIFKISKERQGLWEKYDPKNFPVWSWKMSDYKRGTSAGGLYGLPRTKDGLIKFGFRGAKWTNYTWETTEAGREVSYPKTDLEDVPEKALEAVRSFCQENLPDLLELELQRGRLCWYTDSVDNSFLIDRVPGVDGLMVASGGSGHGFKFLPVLGKHVVDIIEGKVTDYTKLFSWRDVPEGTANGLKEGPSGWRTLDKQTLVGRKDWSTSEEYIFEDA